MIKSLAVRLARGAHDRLPRGARAAIKFYRKHRYLPSLRRPRTFSEHIHVRKLRDEDERFSLYADKLRVKEVVRGILGDDWLIPTIWSGPRLPERRQDWPVPFVLKANFGCGLNAFVRAPGDLDWGELRAAADRWAGLIWPASLNEEFYNRIPRQLLVEPLIGGDHLPDYKFLTFGGTVALIEVDTDRFTDHKRAFYSPDWQLRDIVYGRKPEPRPVPRPTHLSDMIKAASLLARPFAFARIDFYDLPDGPKFGEVTFTPAQGLKRFVPAAIDVELGRLWSAAKLLHRSDDLPGSVLR